MQGLGLMLDAPKPVFIDSRICFSVAYFRTEREAVWYGEIVRRRGDTYNGGYRDGEPCGRAPEYDRPDLFAVTQR